MKTFFKKLGNLWICTIAGLTLIFTSCGEGVSTPEAVVIAGENPYQTVSGVYFDTLPCSDCKGVITKVTLFPDSTFSMRELRLGGGRDRGREPGLYGSYVIESGQKRLKLTPINVDRAMFFRPVEGGLLALDEQGEPFSGEHDYILDRTDQAVGSGNASKIRNQDSRLAGLVGVVYQRSLKDEILVDEDFIRSAPETEQAVIAFYMLAHETACPPATCPVHKALALDDKGMKDLVVKWLGKDERVRDVLTTGLKSGDLQLLQVVKTEKGFRATRVIKTPTGPERSEDYFETGANQLTWVKSEKGKIDRNATAKNTDRPAEFQQGGKQVIQLEKLQDKPKRGVVEKNK